MLDLRPYAVFAEVAAAGSMTGASRRLGMTPSAVSQIIAGLERRTGVSLFHRSTRKLSLTEAGQRCLPHCLRMVEAATAAAASLEQARDAPSGELRISAPVGFGAHVAPALAPVLAEWPQLRLQLIVDDALIDLVEARIDIALRVGPLPDSGLIARKVGDLQAILCAAPAYLEREGAPIVPADLERHQRLALVREWFDTGDEAISPTRLDALTDSRGRTERVRGPVRIATTNQIALQQMCEEGMGVAALFFADARHALERGSLTRVLPDWTLPSRPLHLITPRREGEPAKVRVALAALGRYFSAMPAPR